MCIHIDGYRVPQKALSSCTLFRAIGRSTLRLKGCRPRVAIFNSMVVRYDLSWLQARSTVMCLFTLKVCDQDTVVTLEANLYRLIFIGDLHLFVPHHPHLIGRPYIE